LPDLDERFEELVLELRATRVAAPAGLRERVAGLDAAQPVGASAAANRRRLPVRRLALAAVPAAVALALAGALVAGLATSGGGRRERARALGASVHTAKVPLARSQPAPERDVFSAPAGQVGRQGTAGGAAGLAPSGSRAQLYTADLYLRVASLSGATKSALALTRALGGYVRSIHYADGSSAGDAELVVRVPVGAVQRAIVRFSALGTILTQRVVAQDVQPRLDARFRLLQALRRDISKLQRGPLGSAATRKLIRLRRELRALEAEQAQAARRVSFATVALGLTTRKASKPSPQAVQPPRIRRTLERAGAILLDEAVVVLYVLIVGGPIALLAAFFLAGGRVLRRRGVARLLERS
jgi:hypothetical protein